MRSTTAGWVRLKIGPGGTVPDPLLVGHVGGDAAEVLALLERQAVEDAPAPGPGARPHGRVAVAGARAPHDAPGGEVADRRPVEEPLERRQVGVLRSPQVTVGSESTSTRSTGLLLGPGRRGPRPGHRAAGQDGQDGEAASRLMPAGRGGGRAPRRRTAAA